MEVKIITVEEMIKRIQEITTGKIMVCNPNMDILKGDKYRYATESQKKMKSWRR